MKKGAGANPAGTGNECRKDPDPENDADPCNTARYQQTFLVAMNHQQFALRFMDGRLIQYLHSR